MSHIAQGLNSSEKLLAFNTFSLKKNDRPRAQRCQAYEFQWVDAVPPVALAHQQLPNHLQKPKFSKFLKLEVTSEFIYCILYLDVFSFCLHCLHWHCLHLVLWSFWSITAPTASNLKFWKCHRCAFSQATQPSVGGQLSLSSIRSGHQSHS